MTLPTWYSKSVPLQCYRIDVGMTKTPRNHFDFPPFTRPICILVGSEMSYHLELPCVLSVKSWTANYHVYLQVGGTMLIQLSWHIISGRTQHRTRLRQLFLRKGEELRGKWKRENGCAFAYEVGGHFCFASWSWPV